MQGNQKYSTVHVRGAQLLTILLVVGLAITALAGTALAADPPLPPYVIVEDATVPMQTATSFDVPIKVMLSPTEIRHQYLICDVRPQLRRHLSVL